MKRTLYEQHASFTVFFPRWSEDYAQWCWDRWPGALLEGRFWDYRNSPVWAVSVLLNYTMLVKPGMVMVEVR